MQAVSSAWKANQRQNFVNESFIEISLQIADPDALADATAKDNGAMWFSNTLQIVDGLEKHIGSIATLETNLWTLDGSANVLRNNGNGDTGFVGNILSNDNAIFTSTPVISIEFSEVHVNPIPGITITWAIAHNEYAVDFVITAYNGPDIVATSRVTDNSSVKSVITMEIIDYDRIIIQINEWSLPHRRARIADILIGIGIVYSKTDLISFTQEMFSDPLASSLPKYSISYEVDNVDAAYDLANPSGLTGYLLEQQSVSVRYGYRLNNGIEWISGGQYYLSEWNLPQNGISVSFTARDLLEFMRTEYTRGIYKPDGISLYFLAEEILTEANLPLNPDGKINWIIDETLKNIYTNAPLPQIPLSECLQLIANAACCTIFFDRSGRLHIEPASVVTTLAGYAVATDNGHMWFSNTGQIVDGIEKDIQPYAMMEQNLWLLDGGNPLFPETDYGDMGYVSQDLCGDDAIFETPPIITLQFSRIHRGLVQGLTITWGVAYAEYAAEFVVTAYNGSEVVVRKEVLDNRDVVSTVVAGFQGFDRITVEILKWSLPLRRARIADIPIRPDYEISLFNSFAKSEITVVKPLGGVDVQAYKYFIDNGVVELFNGTMNITGTQSVMLTYSKPAVSVNVVVTGGTLVSAQYFTNTCELVITGTGAVNIVLSGTPLETSETTVSLLTGIKGDMQPVQNPLITSTERAQIVGEWVAEYLSNRTILSSDWRADPRLDALDVVMNQNRYDSQPVRMTMVQFSYNGGFRGVAEGRALLG